jgi:hypothetical protein
MDRSIITDKTVDVNRPDTVLIDGENNTVFVMDMVVPLIYNLPRTEAEKISLNKNALRVG